MKHDSTLSLFSLKKARTFVKKQMLKLGRQSVLKRLQTLARLSPELGAKQAEKLFLTPHPLPLRHAQAKVLQRGSQGSVQVGHDLVRVWRWGSGPGVLLVHGWSGRGGQFADWVDPLVEAGYQVTLFDAPGHGASGGELASVAQFVWAIEEIAKQYGPFESIIGHSMGGAAAMVAVARGLAVEKLITLAAPGNLTGVMERAFQGLMGLDSTLNPLIVKRLESRFGLKLSSLDPAELAPSLDLPWLVMHDLDDSEISWSEAETLVHQAPQAQLLSTKGLGHYRVLRDAGIRTAVKAFIQGENPQPLESPEMAFMLGG